MSYQLLDTLQRLGSPRILVVGDAILDRYIWGDAERVSQEAPVILLRADRDESRLGGAANVAHMVRGLDGRALIEELGKVGVDHSAVFTDSTRPTTVKERFIGRAQNRHPHQMLRVDREVREPLSGSIASEFLNDLLPRLGDYQAILISDYGKGVCTPGVVQYIIHAAVATGTPVVVDPRPGQDYQLYAGATAVTPNRLETKLATGHEINSADDAFAAGRELCGRLGLRYAFITLDSDGIALVHADGEAELLPSVMNA
jgi:D-beta-D-heptose 7-phosphate kinase / D-beta-D-heptose 1-phosphate adenosyltransferase